MPSLAAKSLGRATTSTFMLFTRCTAKVYEVEVTKNNQYDDNRGVMTGTVQMRRLSPRTCANSSSIFLYVRMSGPAMSYDPP
jgi:hypothetical protein